MRDQPFCVLSNTHWSVVVPSAFTVLPVRLSSASEPTNSSPWDSVSSMTTRVPSASPFSAVIEYVTTSPTLMPSAVGVRSVFLATGLVTQFVACALPPMVTVAWLAMSPLLLAFCAAPASTVTWNARVPRAPAATCAPSLPVMVQVMVRVALSVVTSTWLPSASL